LAYIEKFKSPIYAISKRAYKTSELLCLSKLFGCDCSGHNIINE